MGVEALSDECVKRLGVFCPPCRFFLPVRTGREVIDYGIEMRDEPTAHSKLPDAPTSRLLAVQKRRGSVIFDLSGLFANLASSLISDYVMPQSKWSSNVAAAGGGSAARLSFDGYSDCSVNEATWLHGSP